ncbi:MAG: hypothetical protein OCD76_18080 [Reichenbachiella sp.]
MSATIKKVLFVIAFIGITSGSISHAQILGDEAMNYKQLKYHDKLPKYLLSRKSIVLVKTLPSTTDPNLRGDWRELSQLAHRYFRKMKIDAMAYYNIEDIFSGVDANLYFSQSLTKREVKYVILLEQNENGYKIVVTPYNNKPSIISQNQNAWKIEGPDLNNMLLEMNKDVIRAEMTLANYLISEKPEFFESSKIIKGRRIPTYAMDLKVEKLIVSRFQKLVIEDPSKADENYKKRVAQFNAEIDQKNQRLEEIMKTYSPLKYELTDKYLSKDIYNEGHQFAIYSMTSTGKQIKESLGYDLSNNETDYVTLKATQFGSMAHPLSAHVVVTKFYVKHVYTKDVYTGLKWDADLTWEESLTNFIFHMKDILKVK